MDLLKKVAYKLLALILLLSITTACEEDDQLNIIAGLDFNIAELNPEGTKFGVIATTVPPDGRIVYTIDFGNPDDAEDVFKTSGPMVTYTYPEVEESVTYTITVTASLAGREDVTITKDVTVIYTPVVNPGPGGGGASPIVGTWKLAPEAGALGVGPGLDNVSWWSNNEADVTTRACLFDDLYIFKEDGTFQNVLGDQTWIEPWQGASAEECGAPVFPHDGTASATYAYDEAGGTVTITGKGAFLGLAKVINGAEIASPAEAADAITYIAKIDGNTMELDIQVAGDGHWSFKLIKEEVSNAIVGTWKLAPEAAALGVGPGLDNISWWSNSSEDVTTRACLFDDEYVFNADGTFQNILGDQTWVEPWQGASAEECGTPVFPHDGTATATYSYDESAGTLTINGKGAFMGLAKVVNGAELASPAEAAESITYIAKIDGNTMELDIQVGGDGHWSFKFIKQEPPANPLVGTWKLAPEAAALGVGPGLDNISWWSNSSEDVTTRACLFDDEYVFNNDGTFQNILGDQTWIEPWQGASAEECGAPVFPHDGTASATYVYDESGGTITLNGKGAFLGLAKVVNGAELGSPSEAADSITYIANLDGDTLELDIQVGGDGHWSFKLVRQ
ncbi:PKD domain-containing protein [Seonamhaeicola sp.]|uniref:PKD domain-containing protein n=1 Tax=Seonamhaeicola sp. TaxID=1912245 RepID=UPI002621BD07|nr:PKD domain-containing protein [Seonamhaeicola sp.]